MDIKKFLTEEAEKVNSEKTYDRLWGSVRMALKMEAITEDEAFDIMFIGLERKEDAKNTEG